MRNMAITFPLISFGYSVHVRKVIRHSRNYLLLPYLTHNIYCQRCLDSLTIDTTTPTIGVVKVLSRITSVRQIASIYAALQHRKYQLTVRDLDDVMNARRDKRSPSVGKSSLASSSFSSSNPFPVIPFSLRIVACCSPISLLTRANRPSASRLLTSITRTGTRYRTLSTLGRNKPTLCNLLSIRFRTSHHRPSRQPETKHWNALHT